MAARTTPPNLESRRKRREREEKREEKEKKRKRKKERRGKRGEERKREDLKGQPILVQKAPVILFAFPKSLYGRQEGFHYPLHFTGKEFNVGNVVSGRPQVT